MKEFRGTPGEWRLNKDCNDRWHVIGPGTDTLASCWHPGRNPGSMEDNARLMAASKDLLEALQDLQLRYRTLFHIFARETYHSDSSAEGDLNLALATSTEAIRKALGE